MGDEVQNVAIVFTDLVGSTALSSSLAPAVADVVRRNHFSLLRQAISHTGGTEVKSLGDGLMAVYATASAGLAAAVAMQQAVELDGRTSDVKLDLRVAMSMGDAKKEGDDYFGEPVIEAARLCARAEGGQILTTGVVRSIARRRAHQTYVPLGETELKGLPEPVDVYAVQWEPITLAANPGVPIPKALASRPPAGVVGRDGDLATVAQAYKQAAAGQSRQVVLIGGEAGTGKTTLAAEAARAADGHGAWVLLGRCQEDLSHPYQLFAEALAHLVAHVPKEVLAAHLQEHGPALATLVPAIAATTSEGGPPGSETRGDRRPPPGALPNQRDAESSRYLLFAAAVGLLSAAAEETPIVLVLDDLQWADTGSLQLLRHLVAWSNEARLLVIGTYRDTELSRAHPLLEILGVLHREQNVTRIKLRGLDDDAVQVLMSALAGRDLDIKGVDLAHAVYRETDGNPLFVGELLRDLVETRVLYRDEAGGWNPREDLSDLTLPITIREVIGGRVARLGDTAAQVLTVAAVIGRQFDLELLARASGRREDELLDVLDAAALAALVEETVELPGHYAFLHAAVQHTLYQDMGPTRRARLHKRVAEALEEAATARPGTFTAELAHHWYAATRPVDVAKALHYCRQAGDEALASLAPEQALEYFSKALELLSQASQVDEVIRLDVLIGMGTAQAQAGNPAHREILLRAARMARQMGDTERLVAAMLANPRGTVSPLGVVDQERVAMLEAALDGLRPGHPDRALLAATLCSALSYSADLDRRRALAAEAEMLAREMDNDADATRVLNLLASPLAVPELLEESLSRTSEALRRAEASRDRLLIYASLSLRGWMAARAGDIDQEDRCLSLMQTQAEAIKQPVVVWNLRVREAVRALVGGDPDEAERLANEALEVGAASGQPDAGSMFTSQVLGVHFERGTAGTLIPLIQQAAADNPGVPTFRAALSLAFTEDDRLDEAAAALDEFGNAGYDLPLDLAWLTGMLCYAGAAVQCRHRGVARALLERLTPWADQLDHTSTVSLGPVSHYLGGLSAVLGRYQEAEAFFRRATELTTRIGARFFLARAQLEWGSMMAERGERGDAERAGELLNAALSSAAERGYEVVRSRAARALADA